MNDGDFQVIYRDVDRETNTDPEIAKAVKNTQEDYR